MFQIVLHVYKPLLLTPQIKTYRYSPCVLCTMPYTCSGKNSYAEPVQSKANIENQGLICPLFLNKRKRYASKMTLHTFGIASN